jgi:hypothetical protein
MAETKTDKVVAPTAPADGSTVPAVAAKPGGLAPVPSYLADDEKEGLEDITRKDMSIPRVALAQTQSPQVTEGDPAFMEGLKPGELFNPLTRKNYGKWIFFQMVHKDKPRAMHLRSIDEGGGVIDPDVPLNSPLLKWGTSGNKKADKPVATLFQDFIVRILGAEKDFVPGELTALSFKSSGLTCAKNLLGLVNMRNKSIYTGRYKMWSDTKLIPKPHKIYLVDNADWAPEADIIIGKEMYTAFKRLDANELAARIGREPGDDDFDAEELERQAQEAQVMNQGAGPVVGGTEKM